MGSSGNAPARWRVAALALAGVAVVVSACGQRRVPLQPTVDPPAAVVRLPVAMGVYYSPEFRAYEHVTPYPGDPLMPEYSLPVGAASVTLFDRVFPLMFESVTAVSSRPPLPPGSVGQTAVIEPKIEGVRLGWDRPLVGDILAALGGGRGGYGPIPPRLPTASPFTLRRGSRSPRGRSLALE